MPPNPLVVDQNLYLKYKTELQKWRAGSHILLSVTWTGSFQMCLDKQAPSPQRWPLNKSLHLGKKHDTSLWHTPQKSAAIHLFLHLRYFRTSFSSWLSPHPTLCYHVSTWAWPTRTGRLTWEGFYPSAQNLQHNPPHLWSWFPPNPVDSVR